jgi:hypothetical protein
MHFLLLLLLLTLTERTDVAEVDTLVAGRRARGSVASKVGGEAEEAAGDSIRILRHLAGEGKHCVGHAPPVAEALEVPSTGEGVLRS